jgi:hypothetical protein
MPQQPPVLEQLVAIYHNAVATGISAIPNVVTGLVVIAAMVVAAKVLERVLRTLLVRLRFDALLQQAGVDKTLHRVGLRESINVVLPRLLYFLLLCLIARIGADLLGLQAVSDAFVAFFGFLPNIVAAVLLLVVGSAASQFAGQTVAEAARESNIDFARSLGNLVSALILFVIGIMALAQLRIDTEIIRIVTICSLSGLALAFGLSFGLGTRAITRDIMAGFYVRRLLKPGDLVDVDGHRGTLRAITSTQTLLDAEDRTIAFANSRLLREVVRRLPADNDDQARPSV